MNIKNHRTAITVRWLKNFNLFKVCLKSFETLFKFLGKLVAKLLEELFNTVCFLFPKILINIKNLFKRFE